MMGSSLLRTGVFVLLLVATVFADHYSPLYKTTDGGDTWVPVRVAIPGSSNVEFLEILAIDPANPSTLYAKAGIGFLKSTDGGSTWSVIGPYCDSVVFDPLATSTLYASCGGGISKSTDSGQTWRGLNLPEIVPFPSSVGVTQAVSALALDPRNPSTIYAGVTGADNIAEVFTLFHRLVFKSADAGDHWKSVELASDPERYIGVMSDLVIDPRDGNKIYATFSSGPTYKSNDAGETWTGLFIGFDARCDPDDFPVGFSPPPRQSDRCRLAIDPLNPSTLYFGGPSGVWKSTDGGAWWARTLEAYTQTLAVDPVTPATLYAGGKGVLKTTDRGATWKTSLADLGFYPAVRSISVDPVNTSNLYAGADTRPNAASAVNGASFRPAGVAPGSIVAIFGSHLAEDMLAARMTPLPAKLLDTNVTFLACNSTACPPLEAPLFFVSPNQINAQVPFQTQPPPGTGRLWLFRVSRGTAHGLIVGLPVSAFSPGIFTINPQGTGAAVIAHAGDFQLVTASNPARPDEHLAIFCTGLGALKSPLASGAAAPGAIETQTTPQVTIGSLPAAVTYSGTAPGYVGLNQVNVLVPANAPRGNAVPVVLTIGGAMSNTVTIAVAP